MELTFKQYMVQQGHTPSTVSSYTYQVNQFCQYHPECKSYKYKDIVKHMGDLVEIYPNVNYRNAVLSAIKRYYDYLIETGVRNDHPCRRLFLKGAKRKKQVIANDLFSSVELEMLMDRKERYHDLRLKNQLITSFLIYQALTPSEIAELKISHIDLDKGTLYLKGSKTISRRHLELNPKQYRLLEKYLKEGRPKLVRKDSPSDMLILGKLGQSVGEGGVFYVVETSKGLFPDRNLNPQSIRQSVIANWLNEKKLPLEQVQLLAGHKWISTTVVYRQSSIEEQRQLINKFHPLG